MRLSTLFTKTSRETPKDELSFNAQILIQAGFIDKVAPGVYTFLPLGLRVIKNIEKIIREEMNNIGGQELLMPSLIPKQSWKTTDRWDNFDALFKLAGFDSKEYGLGATHEEIITPLAQKYAFSYKDLPFSVFQIQNKFRNEKRAKSGLLRGREFFMKDMYSFHADEEDLNNFYKTAQKAYFKIFERCGLLNKTYLTFASGGNFSKHSHEYQTLTSAGEDDIYICEKCSIAINKEIIDETKHTCPNCQEKKLRVERAVEVGNIFKLKTRFSDAFKYTYSNEAGKKQPVIMGCYGIGLGRVMGTVAEVCHDEDGLVWPKELAPFTVHLIEISSPDIEANNKIKLTAEKIYKELRENKIEVLFDDRNETSAGAKFTDADLIGCPLRLVVSERSLDQDSVEVKNRNEAKKELVKVKKILSSKL